ncbi:sigma-70 family RNA polymerase sigma factor [Rubripirellula reticaptiva]|uniref:ECF RNA polymerase sigma factor SigL n=1 Tax=Rubripirellula reticaptiva TaxID=2528013 RepID=A0A5C6FES1_9BACT|nr:sigma-70 family RNA polymerase sigma factor [Rubripirellula reticaptiva]TWU58129.1 ECF RNA polymerase sigma factor SigL [Rubripirellula reticaptiva]
MPANPSSEPRNAFVAVSPDEFFVQQIAEHQDRLFGYVFSLVGDYSRASDVVQETNLVLWRKKSQFQIDQPFLPWAFAIARFQVLAHVRDRGRDRCLLDAELVEQLAQTVQQQSEQLDSVRVALRQCIEKLSPASQDLIRRRYYRSTSINDMADSLDMGVSAVKVGLLRIRRRLAECVEARMASDEMIGAE